jgi:hypothetical protein
VTVQFVAGRTAYGWVVQERKAIIAEGSRQGFLNGSTYQVLSYFCLFSVGHYPSKGALIFIIKSSLCWFSLRGVYPKISVYMCLVSCFTSATIRG